MICPDHAPISPENQLTSLAVLRRICVDRDANHEIAKLFQKGNHTPLSLRVGSLIFNSIGQLLPHQLSSFHNYNHVYPVGYHVTRYYWSPIDPYRRIPYNCSIDDSDGQPEFTVQYSECDDETTVIRSGSSAKAAWSHVLLPIEKFREAAGRVKLFPHLITGEDMFGISEQSVIKMIESLPGVDSLLTYNFKFGRNPLMDLPLAVNPSGCARCEPRFRTLVKLPHTLHANTNSSLSLWSAFSQDSALPHAPFRQMMASKWSQYRLMQQEWRNIIYLARSRIQGRGLYAARDLEMHQMIIEYMGEIIRNEVAERREKQYNAQNRGIYMFRVSSSNVIDATMSGGPGRYINHSCDPNCVAETLTFDRDYKIVIVANRPISRGEELSYDYQFDEEADLNKLPCLCGAPNCRKWMN